MFCSACAAPLPDDASFCPKCAAAVSRSRPEEPSDPLAASLERTLGPQFTILRCLGRGGMGAVYLAREEALERLVAVKVLLPEMAITEEMRERFRREAKTAARLTHPNIVPLHSFGETDDMVYFVMGYVPGHSLGDLMKRKGRFSEPVARKILAELADALDYAHRQGVVHRDLKPDNVLIEDESGKPLLTDFGIAKATAGGSTLTEVGSIVGTPHYMSPEQASGDRDLDGRSDLYSLGVLGYELFAGERPFEGDNLQEILMQHVTRDAPLLTDVVPDTSDDAARAIGRCLAKDPGDRWSDASDFRAAIRSEGIVAKDLPVVMSKLEGMIPQALLGLGIVGLVAPLLYLNDYQKWLGVLAYMALGGVLGTIGGWFRMLRVGKKKGFSVAELKSFAMNPPRWWPFYWPRKWRRPEDVGESLHPVLRRTRVVYGWLATGFLAAIYGFGLAASTSLFDRSWWLPVITGLMIPFAGIHFFLFRVPRKLGRELGIEDEVMSRAINTPTGRVEFWRKPELAGLLVRDLTQNAQPELPAPGSPSEFVAAIQNVEHELTGTSRDIAREAAGTARQLDSFIQNAEREVARISADVDEREIVKLEARIEGSKGSNHDDYEKEMVKLWENQLQLHRRMRERMKATRERCDRMVEMLKTLWLHVSDLRSQARHESQESADVSGKIRSLCSDIEAHVVGTEETEMMLRTDVDSPS